MLEKVKNFLKTAKGKVAIVFASVVAVLGSAMPAMAADDTTTFQSGISTVWSQVTSQINIGNVVAIIGICIVAVISLGLFWWGLRYVVKRIWAALKNGRVKV